MTPSNIPRSTTRWIWIALPVSMLVTLAILVVAVTGFFRLSRDGRCLRDSLVPRPDRNPSALTRRSNCVPAR